MTRSITFALAAAALAATFAAAPRAARAQAANPFSFGVAGGLAVPTSSLSSNLNAGYTVAGFVDFHPVPGPLTVRLEGGYDRFQTKDSQTYATVNGVDYGQDGNTHFIRGNANLLLRLPTTGGVRPYLTGGVGIYGIGGGYTYTGDGGTATFNDQTLTKFGINGGIGIEVPLTGITVFGEVRAHGVQTDGTPVTYIPITVGIRF